MKQESIYKVRWKVVNYKLLPENSDIVTIDGRGIGTYCIPSKTAIHIVRLHNAALKAKE